MPSCIVRGPDELLSLAGKQLGYSPWIEITQERIDAFAEVTGDKQWIHCDPQRAARESPYGTTVAHGFLTLTLAPLLTFRMLHVEGAKRVINYGLNRVRFPNAVRAGSRVRMACQILEASRKPVPSSGVAAEQAVEMVCKLTFEVEGETKPACVAELVLRLYF
jgi:acyl dehydratase